MQGRSCSREVAMRSKAMNSAKSTRCIDIHAFVHILGRANKMHALVNNRLATGYELVQQPERQIAVNLRLELNLDI